MRGIELTPDDLLRRSIIQALMCHFELSIEALEVAHLIDFKRYFAAEIADLREMEEGGCSRIDDKWISVLPRGRMLVRAIAMVFDRYLRADRERTRYSKVGRCGAPSCVLPSAYFVTHHCGNTSPGLATVAATIGPCLKPVSSPSF
jgi:hypothetical protein